VPQRLLFLLLFFAAGLTAQQSTNDRVLARAELGRKTIEIGDQIWLEVNISAPPGTEITGLAAYYSELTHILREYLEGRFDIQALEMTTRQITDKLGRRNDFDKVRAKELSDLLQISDLVEGPGEREKTLTKKNDKLVESIRVRLSVAAAPAGGAAADLVLALP